MLACGRARARRFRRRRQTGVYSYGLHLTLVRCECGRRRSLFGGVALFALYDLADSPCAALFGEDPGAKLPWGIVAHVEAVAAVEAGGPVTMFILIETCYRALHPIHTAGLR